jgi:hypothetical protein
VVACDDLHFIAFFDVRLDMTHLDRTGLEREYRGD